MNDKILELRLAGLSERQIAAQLCITRHRVRKALEGFRPTACYGATWVEDVGLAISRAKYRTNDDEQLALAEFAYDVAEWLDECGEAHYADAIAVSLRCVVRGVIDGSNPLVRIHVRRARRLLKLAVEARGA